MDILRRNTDYGLRMMVTLARHFGGNSLSARQLASQGKFSYVLGCKILQKLHKAGLVQSSMGPKGGFSLNREPSEIALLEVIGVLQGEARLNRCLLGNNECEFQKECGISEKLADLQQYINEYLGGISLADIVNSQGSGTISKS